MNLDNKYYRTFSNGKGSTMVTIPISFDIKPGTNVKFKKNSDGTILIIPEGVVYEETA